MPIEINELIVRGRVESGEEKEHSTQASSAAPGTSNNLGISTEVKNIEKAIQETLQLIKRKNER